MGSAHLVPRTFRPDPDHIMASRFGSFVLISCLVIAASRVQVSSSVHIVKGLSWSYYEKSCPSVESVIRKHLKKVFEEDIGQAAGLLRVHFHDCFVKVVSKRALSQSAVALVGQRDLGFLGSCTLIFFSHVLVHGV